MGVTPGFDDLDLAWLEAKQGAKWHRHGPGRLAAWVADMDFPVPSPVAAALHAFVDAGDLGYPDWPEETPLRALFVQRMADRFAWTASSDHVRELCDVVQGVQVALHLATPPGSSIALHTPAYPPFFRTSGRMGRPILPVPAVRTRDGWAYDHDRFARDLAASDGGCRTLLMCNPQNPTGHVFTHDELATLARLAEEHDLLIISDEIHADLVYEPARHVPMASLGPAVAARTLTLTSATKAFNLAGIRCAVAHVGPSALRELGTSSRTTCSGSSAGWGSRRRGRPGRTGTGGWPPRSACSTATAGCCGTSWRSACPPSTTRSRRRPTWPGWTSAPSGSPTVPRRCCATAASSSIPVPTSVARGGFRSVQLRHQRLRVGSRRRPDGGCAPHGLMSSGDRPRARRATAGARMTPMRRAFLLLLALAAGVALALGPAGPAHAHASLESSSPSASAVLDEPPTDITLDFTEPVTAQDGGIRLLDSSSTPIELGPTEQGSDPTVVVTAVPEIPDGAYVVGLAGRVPGRSPAVGRLTRSRSVGMPPSTRVTCWPRS